MYGRRSGIYTGYGIACGAIVLSALGVSGISKMLTKSPQIFFFLKVICASYLVFLGYKSIVRPIKNISQRNIMKNLELNFYRSFVQGLITSVINPKAFLFFTSIFSMICQRTDKLPFKLFYSIEIILLYLFWFTVLPILLTHQRSKNFLARTEIKMQRILGGILSMIGINTFYSLM